MIYDINNKRAEKLIDELTLLTSSLLITSDTFEKNQVFNTIQEKLDYLKEALFRLRNVQ